MGKHNFLSRFVLMYTFASDTRAIECYTMPAIRIVAHLSRMDFNKATITHKNTGKVRIDPVDQASPKPSVNEGFRGAGCPELYQPPLQCILITAIHQKS